MIDPGFAVHAHHAEVERVRRREAADAEQRHRDRDLRALGKGAQLVHGARDHHAVPGEDHRPLRLIEQRGGLRKRRRRSPRRRRASRGTPGAAASQSNSHDACWASLVMSISTGPGRPDLRDHERFADRARDVLGAGHEVVVLRDRQRDAGDVDLLERVAADQAAADLAGDADDGRGVHHRGGDAGDHVGRARPGRGDRDADAAARARVAVGHVRRPLLVAHQDVANRVIEHGVVGRQNGAARIPKMSVTPSRTRHSQRICAPVSFIVLSLSVCPDAPEPRAQPDRPN